MDDHTVVANVSWEGCEDELSRMLKNPSSYDQEVADAGIAAGFGADDDILVMTETLWEDPNGGEPIVFIEAVADKEDTPDEGYFAQLVDLPWDSFIKHHSATYQVIDRVWPDASEME